MSHTSRTVEGPRKIDEPRIDDVAQRIVNMRNQLIDRVKEDLSPNETAETIRREVEGAAKKSEEVPVVDDWEAKKYARSDDDRVRSIIRRFVRVWNGGAYVEGMSESPHPGDSERKIATVIAETEADTLFTQAHVFGTFEELGISHVENV